MSLNNNGVKKLYNLARGTVRLRISGVCPEKAMNAIGKAEICFYDAEPEDDFSVLISVCAADLSEVKRLAEKNCCETVIIYARGGKEISRRAKRRVALIAGLIVCILIISLSSMFIWNISVEGNSSVSYGEILRMLSECGVECGDFWPTMSADSIENDILLNHPELSWVSLNMCNSKLTVIVHERREKPEIVSMAEPRSLFAEKSGVITGISVLQGKSLVCVGDTVYEGDLIVSGSIDSETGDERQVHAIADITARTWYEISAVTPLYEDIKGENTDKNTRISLVIGKNSINFCSDSRNNSTSCDKINKLRYAGVDGYFTIPLGIAVQSTRENSVQLTEIDRTAATLHLQDDLIAELRYRIGDGEIVSQSFSVSEYCGLLTVTLRAECIENIVDNRE